jgi:hypothetical protein
MTSDESHQARGLWQDSTAVMDAYGIYAARVERSST